ncbi:protein of unknown function [Cyclobacterium lianum]|uniref:DUF4403 family protein n=1 Tax=Cyclobacterium lianum TaxID=388280 RepID=A0A1M7HUN8_9BACT|nr:DUF4403 family protein [Cyclobacterium lianum]SHM32180.1 protein of unknown function [Cyclobacterium lianum]
MLHAICSILSFFLLMHKYSIYLIILFFSIYGWACRSLPMDGPEALDPPPPLPEAPATVNLNMEIPLSFAEEKINSGLGEQLFDEKDLQIGDGLFADIDLKKAGLLGLTAKESGQVVLEMPVSLDGKLRVEKTLFGQRIATALPFQEELNPQISFLPVLKPNWEFDIEDLEILSWGKPLEYDMLGFKIDFEPLVKRQIVRIMENQLRTGTLAALDFKHIANNFWSSFSRPRYVENGFSGTYIYPHAEKLIVHDRFTADQTLLLSLTLEGEMRSQKDRPLATQLASLPDISLEKTTGEGLDITTPLRIGFEDISSYLNETLSDSLFVLDSRTTLKPLRFTLRHYGAQTMIIMDFLARRQGKKDLEGKFYLAGQPVFDPQSEVIRMENVDFRLDTKSFFANSSNWMRRRKIMKAIRKLGVIPLTGYLENARSSLMEMGEWQTGFATFTLDRPDISISGIYPTSNDLVIFVQTKAGIQMEWIK